MSWNSARRRHRPLWAVLAAAAPGERPLLTAHIGHPDLAAPHGDHRRTLHRAAGVDLSLIPPARKARRRPPSHAT
ncbi:hypothetical protein ACFVH6_02340 [Spirillospora sp. NPDC127200]